MKFAVFREERSGVGRFGHLQVLGKPNGNGPVGQWFHSEFAPMLFRGLLMSVGLRAQGAGKYLGRTELIPGIVLAARKTLLD